MLWFIFGIFVCLFTHLGDPKGPFRGKSIIINASRVILVLILSYMTGMGGLLSADHDTYAGIYRESSNISLSQFFQSLTFRDYSLKLETFRYEIGFIFFSMMCSKLGLGVAGYFLLAALITNSFVVKTIYRFKYPVFCILIFIASRAYLQEANIIRQTMAISIFAYALKYIVEKNFKHYLFFIIIAASIHSSLFLTLPLYLISFVNSEIKEKTLFNVLTGLWVLSIFIAYSSSFINLSFLNVTTYNNLLEQSELEHFKEITIDIRYNFFIILLVLFYYRNNFSFYDDKEAHKAELIYITCTILGCIFCNMSVNVFYFYRISLIFDIIYCFYLGTALDSMRIMGKLHNHTIFFVLVLVFKITTYARFCFNNNEWIGKTFYSFNDILSL